MPGIAFFFSPGSWRRTLPCLWSWGAGVTGRVTNEVASLGKPAVINLTEALCSGKWDDSSP